MSRRICPLCNHSRPWREGSSKHTFRPGDHDNSKRGNRAWFKTPDGRWACWKCREESDSIEIAAAYLEEVRDCLMRLMAMRNDAVNKIGKKRTLGDDEHELMKKEAFLESKIWALKVLAEDAR